MLRRRLLVLALLVPGTLACARCERTVTILAINDVYRLEGVDNGAAGGLARVRTLRRELERTAPGLLVLHAGDMLYPSLASGLYDGAQMVDVLNLLDGDGDAFDGRFFATFGNHEFDKRDRPDAVKLEGRVRESGFTWLDTNVEWVADAGRALVEAPNLADRRIVEAGGVRVGLFSVTTGMAHPAYVEEFGAPVTVAADAIAALRRDGADVVVALTHLPLGEDVALLRALGGDGPDLVVGGHEHNRLCRRVAPGGETSDCAAATGAVSIDDGRLVVKADAEARSAAVVRLRVGGAVPPRVAVAYRELGADVPEDPRVRARVDHWTRRLDVDWCTSDEKKPGCLDDELGATRVELVGEELEIRRFETNLGGWIADQALAAYPDADLAFLNAGSLRLNQDLPAGDVTRRFVAETFQYKTSLRLLEISGALLQEVVDHAVTDWTGSGHWLQVAGFAFRHDPEAGTADRLTLLTGPGAPRPIAPEETLRVVTTDYLVKTDDDQDGYTMLRSEMVVEGAPRPNLSDLVEAAIRAAGDAGIAPAVEGRICTVGREGPCRAIAP